jgi:tRNA (guanosine-2'-O-)-methyltransferase
MDEASKKKLITYFSGFVTANRLQRMEQVLSRRTRYVTPVLEDVYQVHNMSAAVRSAEGFGVQDIHIIEQRNELEFHDGISKGASNWTSIHRYNKQDGNNTVACFDALRKQGYWIVATSPHATSYALHELPIDKKIALIFGTEEAGISDYVRDNADASVVIPMYGFTESFNISVSVALGLYDLTTRIRASEINWQLTKDEKLDVQLAWLREAIRGSDQLEKNFLEQL